MSRGEKTLPKKFFNKKFYKVSFLFVQRNGEPSAIGTPHTNSSASLIRIALKSQNLRVLFLARLISIKNEILLKNYFRDEKNEKISHLHYGVTSPVQPESFSSFLSYLNLVIPARFK